MATIEGTLRGDVVRLTESCIYTIVHRRRLQEAVRTGGRGRYHEAKPWTTGAKLLQKARTVGEILPVVFADATDCTRLLCWGALSEIDIDETGTTFSVEAIASLGRDHTPQDLILRSSGKPIALNFIRPYAICRTPNFLRDRLRHNKRLQPAPPVQS
jgi:hypothetical protein